MRKIDKRSVPAPTSLAKKTSYKGEDVKEALNKLYAHKCAYCECDTTKGAVMDVEHYRPKAGNSYPWLEFEWSNLLRACQKCNRSNSDRYADTHKKFTYGKHTNFPIRGSRMTNASITDLDTLNAYEKPLLLNPESANFNPEIHFYFDNKGIMYGKTDEGKESEKIYGLNREPLWVERQKILNELLADIRLLSSDYKEGNISKKYYYSQIKHILNKIVARSLPSSTQEYTFWAAEIIAKFDTLVLPMLEHTIQDLVRDAFLDYCRER